MKNSFVIYTDYVEQISLLTREQRGDLFTAILAHAGNMELPEMDGVTKMAFCFIRSQMDRDKNKYQDTVEKRREAGKQGGRPKTEVYEEKADGFAQKQMKAKKANGFAEKQMKAKKPDNEDVDVDEDVDVTVTVNEDEDEKEKKKGTNVPKEKNPRFVPPSVENVMEYCREKGYENVHADQFVDFYTSKAWYVGRNKMKDWKASVRNWQRQEADREKKYPRRDPGQRQEESREMMYGWAMSKGEEA